MALILQIETSTISCSVALSIDGETIAVQEISERNIHASSVTKYIEEVMKMSACKLADLDAIAVSKGPGSYTGLRIGVSTAKGLCFALDIPLIAIGTLKAMSSNKRINSGESSNTLYCPMIDARRMEVYCAIYDARLNVVLPVAANIIDENSFSAILQGHKIVFFGDGAQKCLNTVIHPNAVFITDFENSASDLSGEAYERFCSRQFEDIAYFEPYYLKDFVATTPKVV